MAAVRYIVDDVAKAVAFYTDQLGFKLVQRFGPAMAIIEQAGLEIWLAGPSASAAKPLPDGRKPTPGGWNRIVVEVEDLAAFVADLKRAGVRCRSEILAGPGGLQILIDDPSGNPIELFQPGG